MRRELLVLCVLALVGAAASAQPQVGPPTNRPAVSPYLNLLRPGNSAGVNYYGLVKPQQEFRNNIQNLQQQVSDNQTAITGLDNTIGPTTGHSTMFLNTGGYFSGGPGRTGGGALRPGAPTTGARPTTTRRR
jgi:hypothetical protein